MMAKMSWRQYSAWQAYANVEPFGEERADLRAGIVASLIANVNRDTTQKPTPFSAVDFMPDFEGKAKTVPLTSRASWQQVKETAKAYAKGGLFSDKRRTARQPRRQQSPTP